MAWISGVVECRVCGHRRACAAPWPDPGLADLPCAHCGNPACDEADDPEADLSAYAAVCYVREGDDRSDPDVEYLDLPDDGMTR